MLGRWTKLRRANVTWQRQANGSTDVVPTLGQRQLASWVLYITIKCGPITTSLGYPSGRSTLV